MSHIDRLAGMILLLHGQRVITAEEIAAHFEISVRTVYPDLSALSEAGVPLVAESGVGYSLMRATEHLPGSTTTTGSIRLILLPARSWDIPFSSKFQSQYLQETRFYPALLHEAGLAYSF